jgi:hypothetical protein
MIFLDSIDHEYSLSEINNDQILDDSLFAENDNLLHNNFQPVTELKGYVKQEMERKSK